LIVPLPVFAADACRIIHGRAHLYSGDGQLRIWHIGTRHDFEPDEASWPIVMSWLTEGTKKGDSEKFASPESNLMLFGDFKVCPTQPFRQGSVQQAKIVSVEKKHYVRIDK
jgi:hypothetical protein